MKTNTLPLFNAGIQRKVRNIRETCHLNKDHDAEVEFTYPDGDKAFSRYSRMQLLVLVGDCVKNGYLDLVVPQNPSLDIIFELLRIKTSCALLKKEEFIGFSLPPMHPGSVRVVNLVVKADSFALRGCLQLRLMNPN